MSEKDIMSIENQEFQEETENEETAIEQSVDTSSEQEDVSVSTPTAERTRRTRRKQNPEQKNNTEAEEKSVVNVDNVDKTPILTVESGSFIETPEHREGLLWHEIRNAYHTRKILQGSLSGIEKTENGNSVAVIYYKDFRIAIPIKEMALNLNTNENADYGDIETRQAKILGNMLGCEIDFIIKGLENKTRTIVASRKDAMLRKRQSFYLNKDNTGKARISIGQKVEARIIAVSSKAIRVEAFGVECSIVARDLSWDWMGNAHERFNVGDTTLIRIIDISGENAEDLIIRADMKSLTNDTSAEKLKTCRVQSKYAGKITDVYQGVVFIRLNTGVNAIAHSCFDSRTPGKNDDISFVVTHIDEERAVAVGIITRIIKQNL